MVSKPALDLVSPLTDHTNKSWYTMTHVYQNIYPLQDGGTCVGRKDHSCGNISRWTRLALGIQVQYYVQNFWAIAIFLSELRNYYSLDRQQKKPPLITKSKKTDPSEKCIFISKTYGIKSRFSCEWPIYAIKKQFVDLYKLNIYPDLN